MKLSSHISHPLWRIAAIALFAPIFVTACGGGGGSSSTSPPPPAGSKTVAGVVGGQPGALTFGGQAMTISGAVTVNGDPGSVQDVKPGSVMTGTAKSSTAKADDGIEVEDVDVRTEIEGPIAQIDVSGGTLQVLGQTVKVSAMTEIVQEAPDGVETDLTLADLVVGDFVEVSGIPDASGAILASRVERERADQEPNEVELRGTVSNLDTTAKTFTIGSQQVDFSGAQVEGTLADGVRVEVHGALNGATLVASKVEVEEEREGEPGEEFELTGVVQQLDSTAHTFELNGFTIDFSTASEVPDNLQDGALVEVEGTVDATNQNLIHATEIEVEMPQMGPGSADTEVEGAITAIDTAQKTFDVGTNEPDVGFFVNDQTVIVDDGDSIPFSQLQVGDRVEVKADSAQTQDGRILATKIELKNPDENEGEQEEIEGTISSFDGSARTFTVNGFQVQVDSNTVFVTFDRTITADEFFGTDRTGAEVEVKGTVSGDTILASRIELRERDG